MQRESYVTAAQFCDDASFRTWVTTGHDQTGWAQWTDANPDRLRLVQEARYLILAVGKSPAESGLEETEEALAAAWSRIRAQERNGKVIRLTTWWRVAAAMLIFAVGLLWYFSYKNTARMPAVASKVPLESPADKDIELYNDSKTARLINLEDGSTVILQPGGKNLKRLLEV